MTGLRWNLQAELTPRIGPHTLRACYWQDGCGWTFHNQCPPRPVSDSAGLTNDLGWLLLSHENLAVYDSRTTAYTRVFVALLKQQAGKAPRPVLVDRPQPGSDEPP